MLILKHRGKFISSCVGWFFIVGPPMAYPLPPMMFFSYLAGAIPAAIAGFFFGGLYHPSRFSGSRASRALAGMYCGAFACFALMSFITLSGTFTDTRPYDFSWMLRNDIETILVYVLLGSIGGAGAGALMPKSIHMKWNL